MNQKQINSILDEGLGFPVLLALKLQHDAHPEVTADELKAVVSERINCLETQLQHPLNAPSWGPQDENGEIFKSSEPSHFSRVFNRMIGGPLPRQEMAAADLAEEMDASSGLIFENLDQSERYHRFRPLYAFALALGIAVFGLAMVVDYQIMSEFWTRALANEFLEVPPSLANSVLFKSFQVVIATVAFHFFLSLLGVRGRAMFVLIFFALSVIMVTGFGFLNAKQVMPEDQQAIFEQSGVSEALDDPFADLGIVSPAEAAMTPPPAPNFISAQTVQEAHALSWVVSPALVFLVITAVGALCLQIAESNLKNLFKAGDYSIRNDRVRELNALKQSRALLDTVFDDTRGIV